MLSTGRLGRLSKLGSLYQNVHQVTKATRSLTTSGQQRNILDRKNVATSASPIYIEEMYESWLLDPKSVHESWDEYFRHQESEEFGGISNMGLREIDDHLSVQDIIRAYQMRGHLAAQLDPLAMNTANIYSPEVKGLPDKPEIVLRHYKLKDEDMFRNFRLPESTYIGGQSSVLTLQEILKRLESVYCSNIGVEYMFINSPEQLLCTLKLTSC